jgi:hypothetical protein
MICLTVISCGGGGGNGGSSNEPDQDACNVLGLNTRIVSGSACETGANPVLKLFIDSDSFSGTCTGTLIAPKKFLTAAHCVTDGEFGAPLPAQDFSVSQGNVLQPLARGVRVYSNPNPLRELNTINQAAQSRGDLDEITNDPNGEKSASYIREFGLSDIAIIELDRAVNLPTAIVQTSAIPSAGTLVSIFGFGITSGDSQVASDVLRSGEMLVDSTGPKNIFARFDNGSNTCEGDSGGPMIIQNSDGSYAVVGTVLGGTKEDCSIGDLSSFTATAGAGIAGFIKQYAGEARFQ